MTKGVGNERKWSRNHEIWVRYDAGGVLMKDIAREYGISPVRVRQIIMKIDSEIVRGVYAGFSK